jgi:ATP-dependent protease Clp ATPase subunit
MAVNDDEDPRGESPGASCSFCGRSQSEVRKLISGPGVHACDRCVYRFVESLEEEEDEEGVDVPFSDIVADVERTHGKLSSTRMPASAFRCSLCRRSHQEVRHLIGGQRGYVCDGCISNCVEILEEEGLGPPVGEAEWITEPGDPSDPTV